MERFFYSKIPHYSSNVSLHYHGPYTVLTPVRFHAAEVKKRDEWMAGEKRKRKDSQHVMPAVALNCLFLPSFDEISH